MHCDPGEPGQDPECVDGCGAAAAMHAWQGRSLGASAMLPVQAALNAQAGLVEVDQWPSAELGADGVAVSTRCGPL